MNIVESLFSKQDTAYKEFHKNLIPSISQDKIIGIRTPVLRKYAKELFETDEASLFLETFPHNYYEENNLHAFLIEQIKNFDTCIAEVDRFLPYIDNWATCDSMKPEVFKKHPENLLPYIKKWAKSENVYTVRYSIVCLMTYYLGDLFSTEQIELVKNAVCDEYYINMAVAWYFAEALLKQYDTAVKVFENNEIENKWVHNKAIQKARESFRIKPEVKEYLKTLKRI